MIIIITNEFSYINKAYFLSFQEFFKYYLNNNTIIYYKTSNKKFNKELEKFYKNIYIMDFFQCWQKIFKDKIIINILYMKDLSILLDYMEYKCNFWNSFGEKIIYSYCIFLISLFFYLINPHRQLFFIYIFIYILLQIFFYLIIVNSVKFNYKSYLNNINKNKFFSNEINIYEFLNNYEYLNNKKYNINYLNNKKNIDFFHRFQKIWKMIFFLPYIFNFINIFISIIYIFLLMYILFQNFICGNII